VGSQNVTSASVQTSSKKSEGIVKYERDSGLLTRYIARRDYVLLMLVRFNPLVDAMFILLPLTLRLCMYKGFLPVRFAAPKICSHLKIIMDLPLPTTSQMIVRKPFEIGASVARKCGLRRAP